MSALTVRVEMSVYLLTYLLTMRCGWAVKVGRLTTLVDKRVGGR